MGVRCPMGSAGFCCGSILFAIAGPMGTSIAGPIFGPGCLDSRGFDHSSGRTKRKDSMI